MTKQKPVVELQGLKTDMCRLCLATSVKLAYIHSDSHKLGCTIANALVECTTVQISVDDGMPLYVCEDCYLKLRDFWKFKKMVLNSDAVLRSYLKQLCIDNYSLRRRNSVKDEILDFDEPRYTDRSSDDEIMTEDIGFDPGSDITSFSDATDEIVDETQVDTEISDDNKQKRTKVNQGQTVSLSIESIRKRLFVLIPTKEKVLVDKFIAQDSFKKISSCQENDSNSSIEKITSTNSVDHSLKSQSEEPSENANVANPEVLNKRKRQKKSHTASKDNVSSNASVSNDSDDDWEIEKDLTSEATDDSSDSERREKMKSKDDNFINKDNLFEEEEQTNVTCTLCSKTYTRKDNLLRHIAKKHPSEDEQTNVKCTLCSKTYTRKDNLQRHIAEKHRSEDGNQSENTHFKCDVCKKTFVSKNALRAHTVDKHSDEHKTKKKRIKCKICNVTFAKFDGLRRHVLRFHDSEDLRNYKGGLKNFSCSVCNKKIDGYSNFYTHKVRHFDKNYKPGQPIQCNVCGKSCKKLVDLKTHLIIHNDERPFQCPKCDKKCKRKDDLDSHLKRIHGDSTESVTPCPTCGKFIKFGLTAHIKRVHSKKSPIMCGKCGKYFKNIDSLRVHMESHDGEMIKCTICNKSFKGKVLFNSHNRTMHHGKEFKCKICLKIYSRASLRIHIKRVHERKRTNFDCSQCKKTFCTNYGLKAHKQSSHGVKQFECEECGKCFSRKAFLVMHLRMHTGEKPYKCDDCDKRFSRNDNLKTHKKKVHKKSIYYKCKVCDEEFKMNRDLDDHIEEEHNVPVEQVQLNTK